MCYVFSSIKSSFCSSEESPTQLLCVSPQAVGERVRKKSYARGWRQETGGWRQEAEWRWEEARGRREKAGDKRMETGGRRLESGLHPQLLSGHPSKFNPPEILFPWLKLRIISTYQEPSTHSKRSSPTPVDRIQSMKVRICKPRRRRPRPSGKFEVRPRATRKFLAGVSHTVIPSLVAEGEAKSLTCLYCNRDP